MLLAVSFLIVLASLYGLIYLKKLKWSFSKRVVIALAIGIILGLVFNQILSKADGGVLADWIGIIGSVYVKLLQMIAVPLILVCVLLAFTKIEIKTNVLKVGMSIIGTLIVTAGIAGMVGIATGYFSNIDGNVINLRVLTNEQAEMFEDTYLQTSLPAFFGLMAERNKRFLKTYAKSICISIRTP